VRKGFKIFNREGAKDAKILFKNLAFFASLRLNYLKFHCVLGVLTVKKTQRRQVSPIHDFISSGKIRINKTIATEQGMNVYE